MPARASLTHYFGGFALRPTPRQVRQYMCGDCGHMALALAESLPGSRLWKLGVGHFAVEASDGSFWDVRGRMTQEQAWEGLPGGEMTPIDRDGIIAELNSGAYRCDRFVPHRVRQARRLLARWLPAQEPVARTRGPRTPGR